MLVLLSRTISLKSCFLVFFFFSLNWSCKKNDSCTDCDKNSITKFTLLKADNMDLPQDINFIIDELNGKITGTLLQWIPSEDPANLVPYFEIKGNTVKVDGVTQTSHVIKNNFKQ